MMQSPEGTFTPLSVASLSSASLSFCISGVVPGDGVVVVGIGGW